MTPAVRTLIRSIEDDIAVSHKTEAMTV